VENRPEIEPYYWDVNNLKWPVNGKTRPDLILFDPPYFSKKNTVLALINADWRDFQSTPAIDESRKNSIMIDDYLNILRKGGWEATHIIQAPMSSERFQANVVAVMQKKKILGVTSRYVIIAKK